MRHRPSHARGWPTLIPVIAVGGCAVLFVGSDVLEHRFLPSVSTGWRHALLTTRAALVAAVGCGAVYLFMVSQQRRINETADDLGQRLQSFRNHSGRPTRFHNPHLRRCREVLSRKRVHCPMYDRSDQPCWQVVALSSTSRNGSDGSPTIGVTIRQCHECEVYRLSCPDGLTRLGESFNSLMFMLDQEAEEVRRMQSQMVEKEKMVAIGQMAAGAAHEIANPLSSISSIVQLLKRRSATTLTEELELIQTHIERITTTVRQMTSLARPMHARWERIDVGRSLKEAIRLVSFDRRAKAIEIDSDILKPMPKTFGLQDELQQVFINLLLNAFDAMPGGGGLGVIAQHNGKGITIAFEDSGCGIPPDVGRRIFEPFFTTKEPGKGTGMGLAVSYNIVQKHGGRIDVRNRKGGGTVFTIELPILRSPPES